MKKKYCCRHFEYFQNAEKEMGLNIRIVKLSDAFLERGKEFGESKEKVFYITEGYSGHIKDCGKKMVISHCPFCGTFLEKKYRDDSFVNEIFDWPVK